LPKRVFNARWAKGSTSSYYDIAAHNFQPSDFPFDILHCVPAAKKEFAGDSLTIAGQRQFSVDGPKLMLRCARQQASRIRLEPTKKTTIMACKKVLMFFGSIAQQVSKLCR
jgi:hypothetical protein